jgi:hypothetical protein
VRGKRVSMEPRAELRPLKSRAEMPIMLRKADTLHRFT